MSNTIPISSTDNQGSALKFVPASPPVIAHEVPAHEDHVLDLTVCNASNMDVTIEVVSGQTANVEIVVGRKSVIHLGPFLMGPEAQLVMRPLTNEEDITVFGVAKVIIRG